MGVYQLNCILHIQKIDTCVNAVYVNKVQCLHVSSHKFVTIKNIKYALFISKIPPLNNPIPLNGFWFCQALSWLKNMTLNCTNILCCVLSHFNFTAQSYMNLSMWEYIGGIKQWQRNRPIIHIKLGCKMYYEFM